MSNATSTGTSNELILSCIEEVKSGIGWKYAYEGSSLLLRSIQEAKTAAHSPELTRRLYIDGVGYLLCGLPSCLSDEETNRIRTAVPDAVKEAAKGEIGEEAHIVTEKSERNETERENAHIRSSDQRSLLRRCIAFLTLHSFLMACFVLRCTQIGMVFTQQCDERFGISERLLAQGSLSVESVGRHTIRAISVLGAVKDGKVGKVVKRSSKWWIQGVSKGVWDGLSEGWRTMELHQNAEDDGGEDCVPEKDTRVDSVKSTA